MKKVWVVFSNVGDCDCAPTFEAVCSSEESAKSFLEDLVTKKTSRWIWMKPDSRKRAHEKMKREDYEIREEECFDYGIVGFVGKSDR